MWMASFSDWYVTLLCTVLRLLSSVVIIDVTFEKYFASKNMIADEEHELGDTTTGINEKI